MKTSRLPNLLGGVCLSAAIMLPLSSPANAADHSYDFIELSPKHIVIDLPDELGKKYDTVGFGLSGSVGISNSSYLRFDGESYHFDDLGSTLNYYRGVFGTHQSITSRVDTFQEIGLEHFSFDTSSDTLNTTELAVSLGLKAKPASLVELEAKVGLVGSDTTYGAGIRFLGQDELEGASLGISYLTLNKSGDVNLSALDFRFNF